MNTHFCLFVFYIDGIVFGYSARCAVAFSLSEGKATSRVLHHCRFDSSFIFLNSVSPFAVPGCCLDSLNRQNITNDAQYSYLMFSRQRICPGADCKLKMPLILSNNGTDSHNQEQLTYMIIAHIIHFSGTSCANPGVEVYYHCLSREAALESATFAPACPTSGRNYFR
jgi:hypothetical protein